MSRWCLKYALAGTEDVAAAQRCMQSSQDNCVVMHVQPRAWSYGTSLDVDARVAYQSTCLQMLLLPPLLLLLR